MKSINQNQSAGQPFFDRVTASFFFLILIIIDVSLGIFTEISYHAPLQKILNNICLLISSICIVGFYFVFRIFFSGSYRKLITFTKIYPKKIINIICWVLGIYVMLFCGLLYIAEYLNQHEPLSQERIVTGYTIEQGEPSDPYTLLYGHHFALIKLTSPDADNGKIFRLSESSVGYSDEFSGSKFTELLQHLTPNAKIILKVYKGRLGEDFVTELSIEKDDITLQL